MASHAGQDRTRERIEIERDLVTQQARRVEAEAALAKSRQGRSAYLTETVPATVSRMAADAVNDEKLGAIFPATLELQKASLDVDGRDIRLSPGMNVTAEIKTGRRR